MLFDVGFGLRTARQAGNRERMHIELGDLVGVAHQLHELRFGDAQGCIRHHVEQADMQLADILTRGFVEGQNFLAALFELGKGWERRMGDKGIKWP